MVGHKCEQSLSGYDIRGGFLSFLFVHDPTLGILL